MQSEMFCDPRVPIPHEGWKGQLDIFPVIAGRALFSPNHAPYHIIQLIRTWVDSVSGEYVSLGLLRTIHGISGSTGHGLLDAVANATGSHITLRYFATDCRDRRPRRLESEVAFSRAFKRLYGAPPGSMR